MCSGYSYGVVLLYVGKARDAFMSALDLGPDPTLDSRAEGSPVGLKVRDSLFYGLQSPLTCGQNLGATCYANAFLQVRT